MLLKGLLVASALIVGIAIFGYSPLPEGIESPYATQIINGVMKLGTVVHSVRELLGYGSIYQNLKNTVLLPSSEGDPASASYGDLKVTRDILAGIPVIVYQPKETSSKLNPGIVFFHGGGWTILSADFYDKLVYNYAKQTGTVIVSVDYRLAPEHPFPIPIQDCLDVTKFILRNGAKYNIDVKKVGVAGDSAGGNLAAAVSLKLAREKSDLPPLLFQILHFPAMQAFDLHLPSYVDLNQTMNILTLDKMAAYYASYIGIGRENIDHYTAVLSQNRHIPANLRKSKYAEFVDVKLLPAQYQKPNSPAPAVASGHDEKVYAKIKDVVTNPLFSPLMSPDLTGLPPAFIHVCEFDVLRDDALLYAKRLQDAGVKVQLYFGKGGYHGDIIVYHTFYSDSGHAALSRVYSFIKEMLK
jgi:acetyl esterase/lipase